MRKLIYLFFIVSGVVVLSAAENKSAGPPGCFAGEPPNNTNCTSCHTDFAANTGTAAITFDVGGADTGYVPGAIYDITVSVKKAGMPAAGFQFTVLQDDDVSMTPGTIALTDPVRTQKVDSTNPHVQGCGLFDKVYVEHTYQGITSDASGESQWHFFWQAPANSVGDITFYLATVESNLSGDEFGDYVYTRKVTSKGIPNNIVDVKGTGADISVYPNPAVSQLHIKAGKHAIKKIELMNMQGVRVKQFNGLQQSNMDDLTLDLSAVSSGIYFVVMRGEDINVTRKIVIQE